MFSDGGATGSASDLTKTILQIGADIPELDVAAGGVDQLPPASLQQFLKAAKKRNADLPGVVLTEHQVQVEGVYFEFENL